MIMIDKMITPPVAARSSFSAENDVALLTAARAMNRDALVRIFDLYAAPLYSYALRLCRDPLAADHIVGDVFARFLDQLAAGHGPETNLRSYLYQMAYHLVIDEARYAGRRLPVEALDAHQVEGPVSQNIEKQMMFQNIMNAIRRALTNDQRHVIVLRFLEGMSVKQTAEIMGKREAHVKVIQSRAIKALRKTLHGGPDMEEEVRQKFPVRQARNQGAI